MANTDKQRALDYINQMFPTEASLSGVEPLMQKIQSEIRRVDAEILAAVRQQSNSGSKAREELAAATHAVQELIGKIREIKTKAEQSETMVQEICRDIKKLDFAKKHITTTITALHRLTMLVSAVEQLQVMASKRQYKEAAAQLEDLTSGKRIGSANANSGLYYFRDESISGELAENVSKIVDPIFVDRIDMSEVQDEFSAVITKALVTLVHGIETKFEAEMGAMTRVPWGTIESVGDQSEYVNNINTILTASIPVLGNHLSPIYFQFFLDKLASSLGPRFYLNIFKCKQISETGAQQMLLDTQAVKTILLDVPSLGKKTSVAAGYSKFVSREMSKAEALLKVILSPTDSVADTYCALLPEVTPSEFQRILDLKGLKRTDQQSILDDYNKRGAGTYQASIKTVIPSAPRPAPSWHP